MKKLMDMEGQHFARRTKRYTERVQVLPVSGWLRQFFDFSLYLNKPVDLREQDSVGGYVQITAAALMVSRRLVNALRFSASIR